MSVSYTTDAYHFGICISTTTRILGHYELGREDTFPRLLPRSACSERLTLILHAYNRIIASLVHSTQLWEKLRSMIQLGSRWSLVQLASTLVAARILWALFKNYLVSSSLDNVPGPSRSSFWTGMLLVLTIR